MVKKNDHLLFLKIFIFIGAILFILYVFSQRIIIGGECSANPYLIDQDAININVSESVRIALLKPKCSYEPWLYIVNKSVAHVEYRNDGIYLVGDVVGETKAFCISKGLLDVNLDPKDAESKEYIEMREKEMIVIKVQ